MTLNVTLGATAIPPHSRSVERSEKSDSWGGPRFDDALDNQSRRKGEDTSVHRADEKPQRELSLEALAVQVTRDHEFSDEPELDPATEFDAALDQFLEEKTTPDALEVAPTAAPVPAVEATDDAGFALDPALDSVEPDAETADGQAPLDVTSPLPTASPASDGADTPPQVVSAAMLERTQAPQEADKRRSTARPVPQGQVSHVSTPAPERQPPLELQPTPREELVRPRVLESHPLDGASQRNAGRELPEVAKVNVLNFSTSLPPVSPGALGPTVTGLVSAMEGDVTWRSATLDSAKNAENRPPNSLTGVNTLRIQLNPAELGMVTARLTASGQQLSVEIQVETAEARQKLTSDSEIILKALRGIGYDVERVTITQSSANASGNPQNSGNSRDKAFQNMQSQGDDHTRNRDNGDGQQDSSSDKTSHGSGETVVSRAGSDIYI